MINRSLRRVTQYVGTEYGDCTQVPGTIRYYASQVQAKSRTRQKHG